MKRVGRSITADVAQGVKGGDRGDQPGLRVFCVTIDVVEERKMRRRAQKATWGMTSNIVLVLVSSWREGG